MTINFQCPHCKSTKSVSDERAGKTEECQCGAVLEVPYIKESSAESVTEKNVSSGGIFDGLLPPMNDHNSSDKRTTAFNDHETQSGRQDYQGAGVRGYDKRSDKKRPGLLSEIQSGLVQRYEIFVKGSLFGCMLAGPLLTTFGWIVGSSFFFYSGCAISLVWIPILMFLEQGIYSGEFTERLGVRGLNPIESLMRTVKLLVVALISLSVVLGAHWFVLALSEPLLYYNAGNTRPIAVDRDSAEVEKARASTQRAWEDRLRKEVEDELMAIAPKAAAQLVSKKVSPESEAESPLEHIELWKPCFDSQGSDYTKKVLGQFGGNEAIVTSPNSRFVLHDQVLYDFETGSKKVLNGRRYSLVSPANADRLVPIEISPDGGLILFKLLSDDSKGTQSGTLVVQEFDNSIVKVLPGCDEGYFLDKDKLLIKESKTDGYYCLSGVGFNDRSTLITGKLLALSPNRKYIAFVQEKLATNSTDALKNDQSKSAEVMNQLIIRDSESLTDVGVATYEGIEDLKQGFFSPDGSQILVVGNRACAAVSLVYGKRGLLLELKPNQVCEGWCGFESRYVCAKNNFDSVGTGGPSDRDNAKDALFFFGDVALGGWVFQIKNLDVNQPYRVFRSTCLRNEKTPWDLRKFPESTLQTFSGSYISELSKHVGPRKMGLTITSDWGPQGAIEVVMKEFINRSLGLEYTNQGSDLYLDVKIKQATDGTVQVDLVATYDSSRVVWEATTQLDPKIKLASQLDKQKEIGSMLLFGLAESLNKTLVNDPFPTTVASFWTPREHYNNDLTTYDKFSSSMSDILQFTVSETIDVDNTWYGSSPLFDVSRSTLIDYSIPLSKSEGSDTYPRFIGFVENNHEIAIAFQNSGTGIIKLDLKDVGKVRRTEIRDNFSRLEFLPNGGLLVLYQNQIKLLDLASGKSSILISLPEVCIAFAVSPDGGTLVVGAETRLFFYDLSALRANLSVSKGPEFETQFSIRHGRVRFSPNGKWLCGVNSFSEQVGVLVDLANRKAVKFSLNPKCVNFHVDDSGRIRYTDEAARVFEGERDPTGNINSFRDLGIKPLANVLEHSISNDGTRLIRSDRSGRIEVLSVPSGELIESLWDPGFIDDSRLFYSSMGWAPSGNYFYWLQGNRLLVWEAAANLSDPR